MKKIIITIASLAMLLISCDGYESEEHWASRKVKEFGNLQPPIIVVGISQPTDDTYGAVTVRAKRKDNGHDTVWDCSSKIALASSIVAGGYKVGDTLK